MNYEGTHPYVFAHMTGYAILALVDLDRNHLASPCNILRIWEDARVEASDGFRIRNLKGIPLSCGKSNS